MIFDCSRLLSSNLRIKTSLIPTKRAHIVASQVIVTTAATINILKRCQTHFEKNKSIKWLRYNIPPKIRILKTNQGLLTFEMFEDFSHITLRHIHQTYLRMMRGFINAASFCLTYNLFNFEVQEVTASYKNDII